MEKTEYDVTLELTEDLLGTVPKKREVYAGYIATQAAEHAERERKLAAKNGSHEPAFADGTPATSVAVLERQTEEIETIKEIEDKGWTGFHEDDDGPFLFDYCVKGFLSESARTTKETENVKQLQDKFKRYVFVRPRRVRLPKPGRIEDFAGKPMLQVTDNGIVCERPLRAMTAQGPRVTVVRSDVILAGALIDFRLVVLKGGGITKSIVAEVLDYGQYIGLGQWRSGGFGRFQVNKLEKL